jgi:hypothetical protein
MHRILNFFFFCAIVVIIDAFYMFTAYLIFIFKESFFFIENCHSCLACTYKVNKGGNFINGKFIRLLKWNQKWDKFQYQKNEMFAMHSICVSLLTLKSIFVWALSQMNFANWKSHQKLRNLWYLHTDIVLKLTIHVCDVRKQYQN